MSDDELILEQPSSPQGDLALQEQLVVADGADEGTAEEVEEQLAALQEEYAAAEAQLRSQIVELRKAHQEKVSQFARNRARLLQARTGTRLPGFWLRCLKQHPVIRDTIEEHDEPLLAYLQNISCKLQHGTVDVSPADHNELHAQTDPSARDRAHLSSFTLSFKFAENPHIAAPLTLSKTYYLVGSLYEPVPVLAEIVSTNINWQRDRDVTRKWVKRKQKSRRTKQVRYMRELVAVSSFFNFFTNFHLPSEEELKDMKPEDVENLQHSVESDFETGLALKDKIIPNAYAWYIGDAHDSDLDSIEDDSKADPEEDHDRDEANCRQQ